MPKEDRSSRNYPPGHGPPFARYFDDPAIGFSEEMVHIAEQEAQTPTSDFDGNGGVTGSPSTNMRAIVDLGHAFFPTHTSRRIFSGLAEDHSVSLIQEWATLFMKKQQDYGDRADDLGIPGQYAELSRKMIKLRAAMWEGRGLVSEPPREVVLDLIGHLFLTLKLMEDNNFGGKGDV